MADDGRRHGFRDRRLVVGLVAIIRAKDRGLLTIVATALGALLIWFLLGEAIAGG